MTALFVAGIVLVYLAGLTLPLLGPDEPRYAQVAREMFERGDWVTPTLGGFYWFEKPALLYWLEIVAYHIFGVSEFSARVGPAVFGLGTIAALYLIAKFDTERDSRFPFTTTLVAASTIGIVVFSRGASFDIIVTFPLTAAIACFYYFDRKRKAAGLFVFYLFVGMALLAKGLIGILFPYAIVAGYHVLSWRRPSRALVVSVVWGTMLATLVASVWYLPMYLRHGYAFIDEFIIQHHFQRFTSNKYFHPQPFYFFFWVLPLMTVPWLPFFIAGVYRFVRETLESPTDGAVHDNAASRDLMALCVVWIVVPFVFFSFSGSKLPGYILPAVPPAIVIAAQSVFRFATGSKAKSRMIYGIAAGTFAVVAVCLVFAVPRFAAADSVKDLIAAADSAGYADSKVVGLHVVSHNAEFYAAGRLFRAPDGKQRKLPGPAEVEAVAREEPGKALLVLVPLEYLYQLQNADRLKADVIKDNGELAIVAVTVPS